MSPTLEESLKSFTFIPANCMLSTELNSADLTLVVKCCCLKIRSSRTVFVERFDLRLTIKFDSAPCCMATH